MLTITVETINDAPCPSVGITVEGLSAGEQTVSIWRASDGERAPVRGARGVSVVDSFYVQDFEVPLGRDVFYELEVLEGSDAGVRGVVASAVVSSTSGFIQDPLNPSTAVPVHGLHGPGGEAYLRSASFTEIQYVADASKFQVMGGRLPVSISGTRQAASGIPFSLSIRAEAENRRMRELVMSSVHLVVRPLPEWGSYLPASATYEAASVSEIPVDVAYGGSLTRWETTGDIVRPSSARLVVSLFTYQDVEALFVSYDDKQAAAGDGTYLEDQKKPSGSDVPRPVSGSAVDGGNASTTVFESTLDGGI